MLRTILLTLAAALCTPGAAPAAPPDTSAVPAAPRSNALPPHWERGVFMEVVVRDWADSDGDGIGDLRGLISTLDELQDLGIRGLWLRPVTAKAEGGHGRASTDHRAIASEYGTLDDFDGLLRQAHARGIGVIMDYVINHASARHPFFIEALKGPDNPFHRWFVWGDEAAPAAAEAPEFDFRHPAVRAYHEDSLRFWLNRGLDGYRLDGVPHRPQTRATGWNDPSEARAYAKALQDLIEAYPQRYVACEAPAQPQEWGDERRMRLAAATRLLQPGTPFIRDEEIGRLGLRGLHNGTPDARNGGALRPFYKAMIGLRNAHPSIARGSFERGSAQGLVAVWQRRQADGGEREHTVTIVNHDTAPAPAQISGLPPRARLVSLHPAGGATATRADAQGVATLLLAPLSVRVLEVSTAAPNKKRPTRRQGHRPTRSHPGVPRTR